MSQKNVQIVRRAFEAYATRGVEGVLPFNIASTKAHGGALRRDP